MAAPLPLGVPEPTPREVSAGLAWVRQELLRRSRFVREGDFREIGVPDLSLLFDLYDRRFFGGALGRALGDRRRLRFRLSSRMTSAGGKTFAFPPVSPGQLPRYEIAVSTHLLFTNFGAGRRSVEVNGLRCRDRLEALQRVFEHELLHLAELLARGKSSCRARAFGDLARRLFGHADVTHRLVTPRERAAESHGVRPGDRVRFTYGGMSREGRVNRITKRATVLVEDPRGVPYSDGRRYVAYYVPLAGLRPAGSGVPRRGA